MQRWYRRKPTGTAKTDVRIGATEELVMQTGDEPQGDYWEMAERDAIHARERAAQEVVAKFKQNFGNVPVQAIRYDTVFFVFKGYALAAWDEIGHYRIVPAPDMATVGHLQEWEWRGHLFESGSTPFAIAQYGYAFSTGYSDAETRRGNLYNACETVIQKMQRKAATDDANA